MFTRTKLHSNNEMRLCQCFSTIRAENGSEWTTNVVDKGSTSGVVGRFR